MITATRLFASRDLSLSPSASVLTFPSQASSLAIPAFFVNDFLFVVFLLHLRDEIEHGACLTKNVVYVSSIVRVPIHADSEDLA